MTVYQKEQFKVYKVGKGYILHNTNKPFQNGHTHLKSLSYAKTIIDNVLYSKTPHTKNQYLLSSHIRVAENPQYIQMVYDLKQAKTRGKLGYYNRHKKGGFPNG